MKTITYEIYKSNAFAVRKFIGSIVTDSYQYEKFFRENYENVIRVVWESAVLGHSVLLQTKI